MNYKHLQEIVNIENKPIDYYTKKESCEWTCEKCNNKDSNYKECKLYNTPQTLIIHLSRFRYDHFTNSSDKIKSKISYNEFLNIKNYKLFNENKNNIYELYGILYKLPSMEFHRITFPQPCPVVPLRVGVPEVLERVTKMD